MKKKEENSDDLSNSKADICLLQETLLVKSEKQTLIGPHFNQAFSATCKSKQRGLTSFIY